MLYSNQQQIYKKLASFMILISKYLIFYTAFKMLTFLIIVIFSLARKKEKKK